MNLEIIGKKDEKEGNITLNKTEKKILDINDVDKGKKLMKSSDVVLNKTKNKKNVTEKEIFIPTYWTNSEYQQLTLIPWSEKFKNMKNQHYRCEVIEKRIKKKKIKNVKHILETPVVEKKMDDLAATGKEKKLILTYNLKEETNGKPTFWPPRIYDSKLKKLTEEESSFIMERVLEFDGNVSIDEFEEPKQKGKKRRRRATREEKMRFCVEFSTLDYATEEDDDMTQWSDAEL